jgi:hypothetical protein
LIRIEIDLGRWDTKKKLLGAIPLLLGLKLLNPGPQAHSITKLDCLVCGFGLYDMLAATSILADITGN